MKPRMLRAMIRVVLLIVVGISLVYVGQSTLKHDQPSYNIMTDSGVPLESLFDGARAAGFAASPFQFVKWHRAVRGKCGSQRTTGMLSALLRLFEVPSVYAVNCTAGNCGSSYAQLGSIGCAQDCTPGNDHAFATNMGSDPSTGWKYTGVLRLPGERRKR